MERMKGCDESGRGGGYEDWGCVEDIIDDEVEWERCGSR